MTGQVHTVKVALSDVDGQCTVTSLDGQTSNLERHKVRAQIGDTVIWTFDNKCGSDVNVEIGNFRVDEVIINRLVRLSPDIRTEERDKVPFAGLSTVLVQRGQPGELRGQVNAKHVPRTYKYDIIQTGPGRRRVLLDPETEIYR